MIPYWRWWCTFIYNLLPNQCWSSTLLVTIIGVIIKIHHWWWWCNFIYLLLFSIYFIYLLLFIIYYNNQREVWQEQTRLVKRLLEWFVSFICLRRHWFWQGWIKHSFLVRTLPYSFRPEVNSFTYFSGDRHFHTDDFSTCEEQDQKFVFRGL